MVVVRCCCSHLRLLFLINLRSSVASDFLPVSKQPPDVFYKKIFLKFRNTHWKTPALESLFNKVAVLRITTLLNIDSNTGVFQWILWHFQEHSLWRISANCCFCCFEVVFIKGSRVESTGLSILVLDFFSLDIKTEMSTSSIFGQ